MRVLLACVYGTSGIDTYTQLLAKCLAREGHDVLVIDRSRQGAGVAAPGVEVARLPPQRGRVRRIVGSLEAIPHQRRVRRIALDWGAEVVHATHSTMAPARWPALIVNAWDPEPGALARMRLARQRGLRPWPEGIFAISDAIALRRASALVAVTRTVRDSLGGKYGRVVWLPPFVSDEEIVPARRERPPTCVMVANYFDDPRKNVDLAIEAVGRVRAGAPDLRLILVGGWLSAERRAALPDFCETTGRLRPPEVARVLQGAGCCLLPSVWEEFGYAGLEALANGAPLVCGPLPAFADLSSGVFVSKSLEPHDFAEAIDRARSSAGFEFPPECRASSVLPALVGLYETVSAGS